MAEKKTLDELTPYILQAFGKEGMIIHTEFIKTSKQIPTHEEIKRYYEMIKKGANLPAGADQKTYMSNCLYQLAEKEESYINEFEKEILGLLSTKEKSDAKMRTVYNIIEFLNKYHDKVNIDLKALSKYLMLYKTGSKDFIDLMMFYYCKGMVKFYFKEYDKAEKEFKQILTTLAQKEEKFCMFPDLYYVVRETVNKTRIILPELPADKLSEYKTTAINKYWEFPYVALPVLENLLEEEMKKIIPLSGAQGEAVHQPGVYYVKDDDEEEAKQGSKYFVGDDDDDDDDDVHEEEKKTPPPAPKGNNNNLETVELCLALAARIGYVGILVGESWVIKGILDNFKTLVEVTQDWENAINAAGNKAKNLPENNNKLSLNCAYKFVSGIIKLYSGNKEPTIMELAMNFGNKFFPALQGRQNKENVVVTEMNKNDLLLNLYVTSEEKDKLQNYVEKNNINSVLDKLTKDSNAQVEPLILLSMIIAVHGEVNSLLEMAGLEKDPEKAKALEDKAIKYGREIIEYTATQNNRHIIINKPFVLGLILEIYISLQNTFIAKKEKMELKKLKRIFEKIEQEHWLRSSVNIPGLDRLCKLEADESYLDGDYNAACEKYMKAIEKDEHNPILLFNLGYMQFLQDKIDNALATLKRSLEEFRTLEKSGLSPARLELIKKSTVLAQKLIKHLEKV